MKQPVRFGVISTDVNERENEDKPIYMCIYQAISNLVKLTLK